MSGLGSVDVWCRYFCEEFTREEKRGKMKSQKVEYVCGQCARLSDFDPSKFGGDANFHFCRILSNIFLS